MRLIDADALAERAMEDFFGAKIIPLGCLYTAPTVDAVPVVHGKWCFVDKNKVQCSVCLRIRNGKTQRMWEYCPNCGARMDGERRTE